MINLGIGRRALLCAFGLAAWLLSLSASPETVRAFQGNGAFRINLERPEQREFIVDKANLISDEDEKKILGIADKLLTDKATPIIVVTINSMAEHGGDRMQIESFATILFNQWGIGHPKIDGVDWNTGILLLVSKNDRRARIELGAYWRRDKDRQCREIMDELIIPRFKQGNYSAGITAGVEALDKMARDLELPAKPRSMGSILLPIVLIGLAVFTVVSLIRHGSGGWAWLMWAAVFSVIGFLLYQMFSGHRSSGWGGGGGGFSGGSFGGGFSGGGGASGSW